jgi:hypothetical protein
MNNLATILIELLCYLSVEPDNGYDIDETADLQINSWQSLIHDLSSSEKEIVKNAVRSKLEKLQQLTSTTPEQEQVVGILAAYINDELQ